MLKTLALLMAFASVPSLGAELVSSGKVGAFTYFAVRTTKSLKILLPWRVKIGLSDLGAKSGSERFYVNVYAELDTRLDSPDMIEIRSRFPGFKVDAAIPSQITEIKVDFGDGHPQTIEAPPTSQNFFTAFWFLDLRTGPDVWKKVANGMKPEVLIGANVKVPSVIKGETFTLPLRDICPRSRPNAIVEQLLGDLVSSLLPIYDRLRTSEMKQLVLSTAIDKCIQLGDASKIGSISDVLKLAAVVPEGVQDVSLTTDRVESTVQPALLHAEIDISESK